MRLNAQKNILAQIGAEAEKKHIKAWAVGGFVRDFYLGKATQDVDICVEGDVVCLVDFCRANFGAEAEYFKDFGTARVNLEGLKIDFVRCRKEVYPKPAALPVVSPSDLSDDLFRRDFTCNAWALSILPSEFFKSYDLYESRKAIDQKFIAVLHHNSFKDDPTRIFRALRFAGRLNWQLQKDTEKLLKQAVKEKLPSLLSRERIRQELIKILGEKDSFAVLELVKKYRLLPFIYKDFKIIPQNINICKTPLQKLCVIALGMKNNGEDFLKSLHLERQDFLFAKNLLDIYNSPLAPARSLSADERAIIKIYNPSALPALKKCIISGGEINSLGFTGKQISAALAWVASAQRAGKIKTKAEAVKFLRKNK